MAKGDTAALARDQRRCPAHGEGDNSDTGARDVRKKKMGREGMAHAYARIRTSTHGTTQTGIQYLPAQGCGVGVTRWNQTTPHGALTPKGTRSNVVNREGIARRQEAPMVARSIPLRERDNHPRPAARGGGYVRIYGVVYAGKRPIFTWT